VAPRSRRKTQLCRGVARVLLAAPIASSTLVALAQAPREPREPLSVASVLERLPAAETGADSTTLGASPDAPPQEQLIYTARFTNLGTQLLDTVRITSPIPPDLRYVPESASGPARAILFSIDGGATFRPASELEVIGPDGARRAAEAGDYTHVRWVIDGAIDPGASGVVRFGVVPR
jgi:uncharacterized repeat protein (TIGR01451 family)